jgi:hypothetical protein
MAFVVLCIINVSYALSVRQQSYLQNSQDNMLEIDVHKALSNTAGYNLYYYN